MYCRFVQVVARIILGFPDVNHIENKSTLSAVIYTDTLQTVIMLTGAAIVAGKSMVKIGGWSGKSTNFLSLQ